MNIEKKPNQHTFMRRTYLSLIYLLLYFPVVILILYSFNDARYSLRWHGFSMQWYQVLWHDNDLWRSFLHSIELGIASATLATLLSTLACVRVFLSHHRSQKILSFLLLILIIIPDLVLGIALLIFCNITMIPLGFTSLLIAHLTFCIPFAVITIHARLEKIDKNIYFSALDLGASRMHAFIHVMLPLLWPAILSALLLSFTLSFDDVIISYFVAGPSFNILPLTIFSLVRLGVTPELNALCSMTLAFSMVLIIVSQRIVKKI